MGLAISVLLPIALVVIMFSLGVGLRVGDFKRIGRHPKAFAVGAASQLLLIPATAYLMAILFRLPPELALGLMILSFCPGGATSNILTKLSHGDVALSVTLTGVVSLVAVFTMPILIGLFSGHFMGLDAIEVSVAGLGIALFLLTTVPVVLGMLLRHFRSALADRIYVPLNRVAIGLFLVVVITAIAVNWNLFVENLPTLGPTVICLNVALLFLGLGLARLFSLQEAEATAIAIETGIQNAALGITVGSLLAEQAVGLPPFSLPAGVYGVTMYFISLPFALWLRSRRTTI